jgi:predicted ATP-dependent endonuclease of OLD family
LVNNLAIKFSKLRGVFDIDYSEELWEFLSILIDVNEYFIAEIKYSWNPRSSGEESLISQFAELFTAITSDSKKGNVIISIDEGEAYFHPEWQRKYISSLCSFLEVVNEVKELNKKFQIILTSHSPFIVSDIPHYNLIKLQKDENGFTKVMNNQETETLGGNIFKLFQDEFFVDEFISAFAYEKIKEAVEYIKSSGEKVVPSKMMRMYLNLSP